MQTVPAGIAPEDYQCLDFDTGMPPANVWVPTVTPTYGILSIANDEVRSAPNSLYAFSRAFDDLDPLQVVPDAHIQWSRSANFVSTLSFSAEVFPVQIHGGSGGPVEHICLAMGGVEGCIAYNVGATTWGLPYTVANAPPTPGGRSCAIDGFLQFRQWNQVTFKLAKDGVFSVTINGETSTCATNTTINSGTTTVRIGSKGAWGQPQFGDMHYDNVVTYVQR
jgi:hypothetical protein